MIDWWEVEELACLLLKWNYEDYMDDRIEENLDEAFYNKFGIDLETFSKVVEALIPFTTSWKSPLTGEIYQGFVTKENTKGLMRAIIKKQSCI